MRLIAFIGSMLFFVSSYGQEQYMNEVESVIAYTTSELLGTPNSIQLADNSVLSQASPNQCIATLFNLQIDDIEELQSTQISEDIIIKRYQRSINGTKVIHGKYTVIIKNGSNASIHAEHYKASSLNMSAQLTEEQALQLALGQVESDLYAWEATANLLESTHLTPGQRLALEQIEGTEYPSAELVYVKDYTSKAHVLELAYLFMIESVSPEYRDKVYVSAHDGRVLLRDAQLKHGTGDSRYSGRKSFPTTEITIDTFELKGTEPISGIFCETRSLEGLGGTPLSTPGIIALSEAIRDGDETDDPCPADMGQVEGEIADDNWNKDEHRKVQFTDPFCCPVYVAGECSEVKNDDIGLDAQWGASIVARYWKEIHNRNGYDDNGANLLSFVHHGEGYENATWNGLYMKYGDGAYQDGTNPGGMFGPLVSLDVCAHEIGHAICTSTSDLVYSGESGAMNEGFSDIWAASIEQFVLDSIDNSLPYLTWGIGEQIDERDSSSFNSATGRALRWMDHPPAENNPDTYGAGTWWQDPDCASPSVANDFCGIHFNSGVLNKWFYLLSVGSGQAMSPGVGKPAADDEINDKGNAYSVSGIGIRKAEKITYGAEVLLMPNARFSDMRTASIDIAKSLYGPCSNEVEQTIRAWYAVGVGEDFGICAPTIEFNQFNITQVTEQSDSTGCAAQKMIAINVHSFMADTVVEFTTTGSAIEGEDFEICDPYLTFNGTESKSFKLVIYDDKVEESDDTIIIKLEGGGFSDIDTIIIVNDDGIPAIGNSAMLFFEDFESDNGEWTQELFDPATMVNKWFIDAGNTNQAHISFDPNNSVATYLQNIASLVRLKSPQINAIGRKNVEVSFDFEVGGERDAVAPDALFDYGTFQISLDGIKWTDINNYVGTAESGGQVTEVGTYTMVHPELANTTFFLGFVWQNDELNGGSYSFKIDNVQVSGEGLEIASAINAQMSTSVPANETIAFVSNENELLGVLDKATGHLGCTKLLISANSVDDDYIASKCDFRSSKVYNLITENSQDSLSITLYFKESEIDDWSNPTELNILAVQDTDVDKEATGDQIIANSLLKISDNREGGTGYISYTFETSSKFQSFVLTDRSPERESRIVMNNSDTGISSLRSIIMEACPEDTIRFSTLTVGDTFNLKSCDIAINKNLVIIGNGISETILNTNGLNKMFSIPEHVDVHLESLHLIDGSSNASSAEACYNGSLGLSNVEVSGN